MSLLSSYLISSEAFFKQLGWLGVFAYIGGIVLVQLFLAPLSPVAIAAGMIFGFTRGAIAIELGTALGAALNYSLARTIARGPISRRLAGNDKFRLIDAAIGREGWKIIALLRFCPIPFGVANYCYGLTAIRFWPYFLTTIVAILPANLFFVWMGTSAQAGLAAVTGAGRPRHPAEYVLMGVGLVAAFCALAYIGKVARAAVAKVEPQA